jgi:hypothetical protein
MTTQQLSRLYEIKKDLELTARQYKITVQESALERINKTIEEDDGEMAYRIINAYYWLHLQEFADLLAQDNWDAQLVFDPKFNTQLNTKALF